MLEQSQRTSSVQQGIFLIKNPRTNKRKRNFLSPGKTESEEIPLFVFCYFPRAFHKNMREKRHCSEVRDLLSRTSVWQWNSNDLKLASVGSVWTVLREQVILCLHCERSGVWRYNGFELIRLKLKNICDKLSVRRFGFWKFKDLKVV